MLTINFPKLPKALQFQEIIDETELSVLRCTGYNPAIAGHAAVRLRYLEQEESILARRIDSWKKNGQGKFQKTVMLGGVTCEIHHDVMDKYFPFKMKALQKALELLQPQAAHYRFPNTWLHVYMDGVAQGSSGVVGWRNEIPVGPRAVLCLGHGMVETKGSTIADSLCQQRKYTGSEKEFHTTISILHELGHVFHQLQSPNQYFAMADIGTLQSDGFTESEIATRPDLRTKMRAFTNYRKPDCKAFYEAVKHWSRFIGGYCYSGNSNPNEYVAEFFAAVKGAKLKFASHSLMLQTYQALGGPEIL